MLLLSKIESENGEGALFCRFWHCFFSSIFHKGTRKCSEDEYLLFHCSIFLQ